MHVGFLPQKAQATGQLSILLVSSQKKSQSSCIAYTALTRVRRRNINGEGLVEALAELRTAMPAQSSRSVMPVLGRLLAVAPQGLSGLILSNQLVAAASNARATLELSPDRRNTDGRAAHTDPEDQGKQTTG